MIARELRRGGRSYIGAYSRCGGGFASAQTREIVVTNWSIEVNEGDESYTVYLYRI